MARVMEDGIELFNIAKSAGHRYRYRYCGSEDSEPSGLLTTPNRQRLGRARCQETGTQRGLPRVWPGRPALGCGRVHGAGAAGPVVGSCFASSPSKTARTSAMAGSWLAGSGSGRCAWI